MERVNVPDFIVKWQEERRKERIAKEVEKMQKKNKRIEMLTGLLLFIILTAITIISFYLIETYL